MKFERIAHFNKPGENAVEVERGQMSETSEWLVTAPSDPTQANMFAGGVLKLDAVRPDIYTLDSSGTSKRRLVQAMLVYAAFHDKPGRKVATTTIPQDQPEKIDAYESIGFESMGNTRTQDEAGNPLQPEVILVNHNPSRLAAKTLSLANVVFRTKPHLPEKPIPFLARLRDE